MAYAPLPIGSNTAANSVATTQPSDQSIRVVDCTPTGKLWTTSIGNNITRTASGLSVVPATSGQYIRSIVLLNPINSVAIFYFIYHGSAPAWGSGTGPAIADGTLIFAGSLSANVSVNVSADWPGGYLVTNGVTVVVSTTNAGTTTSYAAPTSAVYATVRYGT